MKEAWDIFYNKEHNLLQKNVLNNNDLFVNPIDFGDNNIPNGNSIYLFVCNKLRNITNDDYWAQKIETLSKTFNMYIGYNFSQMFSYLIILDICDENITISFHGKTDENFKKDILKKFMGNASIIYKESSEQSFVVICKNKICSEKLNDSKQIDEYIRNKL